jgi:hypothetical protein
VAALLRLSPQQKSLLRGGGLIYRREGVAYKLRYPDNLEDGFNISLAGVKMLTELDGTAHAIRSGFALRKQSGEAVVTHFDQLVTAQDPELMNQNVAFGTTTRAQAFSKPTSCFELRVLSGGQIMSVEYTAGPIPDDRKFNLEGLTQNP